jgi:hypothetical protein
MGFLRRYLNDCLALAPMLSNLVTKGLGLPSWLIRTAMKAFWFLRFVFSPRNCLQLCLQFVGAGAGCNIDVSLVDSVVVRRHIFSQAIPCNSKHSHKHSHISNLKQTSKASERNTHTCKLCNHIYLPPSRAQIFSCGHGLVRI